MSMRKLLESLDQIDENPLAAMAAGAVVDKLTDEEQIEEYGDVRKMTNKLHEYMDEGMLDPRVVADAALKYMSESEVADMARINELIWDEDEDEDEDY